MKKKYIRPESRLFAINLAENIADGSVPGEGTGGNYTSRGINYYLYPNGIEGYIAGNPLYHFVVGPGKDHGYWAGKAFYEYEETYSDIYLDCYNG